MEGAHYLRPGPGFRDQVSHGLFGSLSVEPAGSTYRDMVTGDPIESGWQADIVPGQGKAFREYVQLYHEVGNEVYDIPTTNPDEAPALPRVDPHTESYRPGSRAINYRSEPFINRLDKAPRRRPTRTARTRSAIRRRRCRAATRPIRRRSASCTPARRCSMSFTCTAAASAGG